MRVLIAMMIVVPFCVLINDFIAMWVGAEYILPASVVVLLVMDLYIHFVMIMPISSATFRRVW